MIDVWAKSKLSRLDSGWRLGLDLIGCLAIGRADLSGRLKTQRLSRRLQKRPLAAQNRSGYYMFSRLYVYLSLCTTVFDCICSGPDKDQFTLTFMNLCYDSDRLTLTYMSHGPCCISKTVVLRFSGKGPVAARKQLLIWPQTRCNACAPNTFTRPWLAQHVLFAMFLQTGRHSEDYVGQNSP